MRPASEDGRSFLSRVLSPIADVRREEVVTALLLTLNVFVLLCTYYLLKIAREPLILLGGGAEVKTYAAAGQSLLLIPVAHAYGWLSKRVSRLKLVALVTAFFVSNLVVFWALGVRGAPLGIPFYLWVGIFNVTMIAQFWSFASDVYSQQQGKRIFPLLGVGSSVGAIAGAFVAKELAALGPFALMGLAAVLLLGALGLTTIAETKAPRASSAPKNEDASREKNGFSLLLGDRYLLLIGALTLLLNWVNTTGEYVLDRTLLAQVGTGAGAAAQIAAYKATYFAWVNALTVILQLFVVGRVLRVAGVRLALFVLPVVSLTGYGVLAIAPALTAVLVAKIAENSFDYSLQNTARQALYLVTSREGKYAAKAVIDTFLVRLGDVLAAATVAIGAWLHLRTVYFIAGNMVLVGAWLGVVTLLGREYKIREARVFEAKASKTLSLDLALELDAETVHAPVHRLPAQTEHRRSA